ncbi:MULTISPECIES: undecaprenyl-phosphate glucose phosphotransferase [unclassified Beijerinckia]|uniref:undecaprenyl-phosphate glucose phosphotransferase n=1 Tax=unclassified Beijerinckia TaxID=2638183 RepID=UPI0008951259|nr:MULTISPECIES: undecaprenyl-phosphate glucose phosphotransferase [unclassified Beijerinckia]MDH7794758.1 Undecaprenyl-phosphate glucose phosphotransferase [Beijerinckia sp. GAS462]SEB74084.1 Undecaprenyl-phosphate glucose phosphotransferase [Beijerinckia sp. 28-YEA-48]
MNTFTVDDMKRIEPPTPLTPEQQAQQDARRLRMAQLAETLAGSDTRPAWSPIVLTGLVRLLDILIICATGFAVHAIYVLPLHRLEAVYVAAIPTLACFAVILFQAFDLNTITAFRAPIRRGIRLACAWTLVFLAALSVIFLFKLEGVFSRVWAVGFFSVGFVMLMAGRLLVAIGVRWLTRRGQLDRRTVIVGGGELGAELLTALSQQKDIGLRIYGVFDDRSDDRAPDVVAGYPKLGTVDDLPEFARHARVDLVILSLPITAEQRLLQMLRKLWVLPIDIRLAAHASKLRLRPRSYSWIGNVPVLDVFDRPIVDWDLVLKSAFDRIVGTLCLILLSPVMLAIAIAVKLESRGTVLFRQQRYGFNNELIEVLKFRSMYSDQLDPTVQKQVTRTDPRVTRVGRFIRRTSLDELPQLFNVVFKGNLSLVGPRPHAVAAKAADREYEKVVDGYFARHRMRPGITGWAQVNGWRGETDTQEKIQQRVEFDLFYIENWSILFDIYILAVTPFALLKAENAY